MNAAKLGAHKGRSLSSFVSTYNRLRHGVHGNLRPHWPHFRQERARGLLLRVHGGVRAQQLTQVRRDGVSGADVTVTHQERALDVARLLARKVGDRLWKEANNM